jgi:hypothetical protein
VEELLSSGKMYAHVLLEKWTDILTLSESFRATVLTGEVEHNIAYLYVSRLTSLWGELSPKLEGRTDFRDLVERFEAFRPYYFDPTQLTGKAEDIFKLHMILREALERLKITRFED